MAFIELHYGPYSENGVFRHRINRLMNLSRYLTEKGNLVELLPSIYMDTLEVIIGLRIAFRCRITFLSQLNYKAFGKSHDPVLVRAIEAIEETLTRVGQVGPNIKIPGLYKEMFNIKLNFGSGVIHNNNPKQMKDLLFEEDDDSLGSQEIKLLEKLNKKRSVMFMNT